MKSIYSYVVEERGFCSLQMLQNKMPYANAAFWDGNEINKRMTMYEKMNAKWIEFHAFVLHMTIIIYIHRNIIA